MYLACPYHNDVSNVDASNVTPDGRCADCLEEDVVRLVEIAERRRRERAYALNVKTTDGLTASEWLLRTGQAVAERDWWKARAGLWKRLAKKMRRCALSLSPMQRAVLTYANGEAREVARLRDVLCQLLEMGHGPSERGVSCDAHCDFCILWDICEAALGDSIM